MAANPLTVPMRDPTAAAALRLLHEDDRPAPLTSVGAALVRAVAAVQDGERRARWPVVAQRCWVVVRGMG